MSEQTKSCGCSVSRHPEVDAINRALLAREDPRNVADRYKFGKSLVYEHRGHLLAAGHALATTSPPKAPKPASPSPAPPPSETPRQAPPVTPQARPEPGTEHPTRSDPEPRKAPASAPVTPSPEPSPAVVESRGTAAVPFRGIVESPVPAKDSGETKTEEAKSAPVTESVARVLPSPEIVPRGPMVPKVHGTAYMNAVARCAAAITDRTMKPATLQSIGDRFGLSRDQMRKAYHEAARHLRLDMGGLLERQETSIAWALAERNDAIEKGDAREKLAADWRERERKAHEDIETIEDVEARIAAQGEAARMGIVASKYGLEAEKWHALALASQKHLDDIQCLVGPKVVQATQVNVGGGEVFERFAALMGAEFAGEPHILARIEAVAARVMRAPEDPQNAAAIVVAGEAA